LRKKNRKKEKPNKPWMDDKTCGDTPLGPFADIAGIGPAMAGPNENSLLAETRSRVFFFFWF